MSIRKNDQVEVISGDEKGRRGKVLKVFPGKDKVLIEGINYIFKHMRKSQQYPKGGRIQKEAPLHISKVMLICEKCQRPVRTRVQREEGGSKRICARCSSAI